MSSSAPIRHSDDAITSPSAFWIRVIVFLSPSISCLCVLIVYRILHVSLSEMVVLVGLSGSSNSVFSSENIVSVVENTENIEGVDGMTARTSDELKGEVRDSDKGASEHEY